MSFEAFLQPLLPYVLCLLAGYHMGGINTAWLIAKGRGFDIRQTGSHNAGTTNAGRTMGLRVALAVFVIDVLKCALMVYLAGTLFPDCPHIAVLTALSCVLGHLFPFYLELRGGKGIAVLLGSALALEPGLFPVMLLCIVLVALLTDAMSAGTLSACLLYLAWFICTGRSPADCVTAAVMVGLIFYKHRGNLHRLFTGQELSLRETFFGGKLRVKKK